MTRRSEFYIYDQANTDSQLRLVDVASIGPLRIRKPSTTRRRSNRPNRPRPDSHDWMREWMAYIRPIRSRLARILHEQLGVPKRRADEVAFHLTDWEYDLYDFGKLIYHPHRYTDREARQILLGLLAHAPNHLAAAAKLAIDCPVADIFGVGAVTTPAPDPKKRGPRRRPKPRHG
jgi:hypothetical protein